MRDFLLNIKKISNRYRQDIIDWTHGNCPGLRTRLSYYIVITRLNRPIGSFLLLWPTLWALWLATGGNPSLHLLAVFIPGVFLTRSAGCVINDFADREYDPYVQRTRTRPMATGDVTPKEGLVLAGVLLMLAFLLVLTTNHLTVLLSFIAVLLALVYPFMKRYTYIPQFFLGLAFSWSIPMVFAAHHNSISKLTWLLFIGNIIWVMIYDTIYAMVDREDDIQLGIKSTAILFDDADKVFIGILQGMMLIVFVIIGKQVELGKYYFLSLIIVSGYMIYHQYLIKDRIPEKCFQAFLNNNWLGAMLFTGILLDYSLA